MSEELETKAKLKLLNIVKLWLRTEHREGNIQSLINLILSFTEPRDKQIAELEKENVEAKEIIRELVDKLNGFVGHHFFIVDKAEAFLKE